MYASNTCKLKLFLIVSHTQTGLRQCSSRVPYLALTAFILCNSFSEAVSESERNHEADFSRLFGSGAQIKKILANLYHVTELMIFIIFIAIFLLDKDRQRVCVFRPICQQTKGKRRGGGREGGT